MHPAGFKNLLAHAGTRGVLHHFMGTGNPAKTELCQCPSSVASSCFAHVSVIVCEHLRSLSDVIECVQTI